MNKREIKLKGSVKAGIPYKAQNVLVAESKIIELNTATILKRYDWIDGIRKTPPIAIPISIKLKWLGSENSRLKEPDSIATAKVPT